MNEKYPELGTPIKSDPFAAIISSLKSWVKDILKYIQILKVEQINVYERRDQVESYNKIDDYCGEFLDSLLIPLTPEFKLSFIKFTENCEFATNQMHIQLLNDYTVTTFPNVIAQSKMRKDPKLHFKIFNLLNEKVLNSVGAVFIGVRPFSKTKVEYEYIDQMEPDFYEGNDFKYFRIERLKAEKLEDFMAKKYKIIFFEINDELTVPYLSKPDDSFFLIRGQISNILRKFNIFYKKEEVLEYVMYNGEKVNEDTKISQYFAKENSVATSEGVKKAPFFKIRKPLEVEPIQNDIFSAKYFIKGQSKEVIKELVQSLDCSKINGEIFGCEMVVFDYTDDRYDVSPEQELKLQIGS